MLDEPLTDVALSDGDPIRVGKPLSELNRVSRQGARVHFIDARDAEQRVKIRPTPSVEPGRDALLGDANDLARLTRALVIAFVIVNLFRLALYPLYVLVGVNNFFLTSGPNSAPLIELSQRARDASAPRVWVDEDLFGDKYWMCNGVTAGEALGYLMILNRVPAPALRMSDINLPLPHDWIAVAPENANRFYDLPPGMTSIMIARTPPSAVHCAPESISLYRLAPNP